MAELWTCRLGTVGYREAHDLQERLHAARAADLIPDVLLLLEHPPVYTRTRRTAASDLPMGEDWYAAKGIVYVAVGVLAEEGGAAPRIEAAELVGPDGGVRVELPLCLRLVPETKGKHLEDIQAVFEERAGART